MTERVRVVECVVLLGLLVVCAAMLAGSLEMVMAGLADELKAVLW